MDVQFNSLRRGGAAARGAGRGGGPTLGRDALTPHRTARPLSSRTAARGHVWVSRRARASTSAVATRQGEQSPRSADESARADGGCDLCLRRGVEQPRARASAVSAFAATAGARGARPHVQRIWPRSSALTSPYRTSEQGRYRRGRLFPRSSQSTRPVHVRTPQPAPNSPSCPYVAQPCPGAHSTARRATALPAGGV